MITKIKGAASRIKHFKIKLIIVSAAIVCCTATSVFAATSAMTTYVYCDGTMTKVVSFSDNPEHIVKKADIALETEDELNLENYTDSSDDSVIYVYKAHNVTINDDGEEITVLASGTVADALSQANISLEQGDKVSVSTDLLISGDMSVEIDRCFGVTVIADGNTSSFDVTKGVVSDVLEKAGITLSGHDFISCKMTDPLTEGQKIVVTRVTYKERTEYEDIDYETITVQSSTLYKGTKEVTTKGEKGQQKLIYSDEYYDGELHESVLKSKETVKKPVVEVISVGTKQKITTTAATTERKSYSVTTAAATTAAAAASASSVNAVSVLAPPSSLQLDSRGRPVSYKKVYVGDATAYSTGSRTASGLSTCPGRIAVDPKVFPYGTELYIVTSDGRYVYGYSVAADTGGFVHNGSGVLVDLFMPSYSAACQFGRREVEVYVLR